MFSRQANRIWKLTMRATIYSLLLLCALYCGRVHACDCARTLNESTADLVFVGTPESAAVVDGPLGNQYEYIKYTFRVSKIVKGPSQTVISVFSHNSDCGYTFRLGREYKVVAQKSSDPKREWFVSICSTTQLN